MTSNIRPIETIPMYIFRWFLILFVLDPVLFGIMMMITIGSGQFLKIGEILGILAPPILTAIAIYLYIISRKMRLIIIALMKSDGTVSREEVVSFAGSYPFKMALFIFLGNSGGPVLVGVLGMMSGIIISFQQALFFIMAGQFEALVVAMLL
jgi:hypothetical protein